MRCLFIVGLLLLAGARSHGAEAEFLRVWPAWHQGDSFERIGEYFGKGENSRREITLRTHSEARAGYYFLVRVKHANPLANSKFVLHIIRPSAPDPVDFEFPVVAASGGETRFQLGITGGDWPGGKTAHPVAWKLELIGADGRVIAEENSFLWEKPVK